MADALNVRHVFRFDGHADDQSERILAIRATDVMDGRHPGVRVEVDLNAIKHPDAVRLLRLITDAIDRGDMPETTDKPKLIE